jgi:hypothetical protein
MSGKVTFTVFGFPVGCFNRLRSFRLTNISRCGDSFSFDVPLSYAKEIKKMLSNFEYTCKENLNFFRGVNFLLNKMTLSVAVLVCMIAFFVLDFFIYDIRIIGAADADAVYHYLGGIGVTEFITKQRVADTNIAEGIVNTFPNVAHANVRLRGNTLVVNIIEAENNPAKVPQNFYSRYDAVIKEVVVFSGRAMVEKGDVVKTGDLLVENAYPNTIAVFGEIAYQNGDEVIRLDISII